MVRVPECKCLNCGKLLNGAATVSAVDENETPSPNDFTFCLYCGHLMAFTDELTLRHPTGEELIAVAGSEELIHMQNIVDKMKN
jgi:hypothetical protein